MIIACPACATRYAVPDTAIGAQGRTVRCAKCRHSWFQDGTGLIDSAAVTTPPTAAPPPPAPAPAPPEAPSPEAASALDRIENASFDEAPSSFAHEPPFRPRRNPARMWTMLAVTFGVLALVAAVAVWRLGLPAWLPFGHSPFAVGQPDLVLSFPPNRQDRRSLANGGEYFGISGTIINVGKQRRNVPQLVVILRDDHERKVYSWEITPAKRVLAPGEALAVSEAMTDIPHSARSADIGWKAP